MISNNYGDINSCCDVLSNMWHFVIATNRAKFVFILYSVCRRVNVTPVQPRNVVVCV